jgi:hypothetical protein
MIDTYCAYYFNGSIRGIYLRNFFYIIGLLWLGLVKGEAQSKAEIRMDKGSPSLVIDGEIYPPYAYMSYLGEEEFYKEIAANGIHIYNVPAYLGAGGSIPFPALGHLELPFGWGKANMIFPVWKAILKKS